MDYIITLIRKKPFPPKKKWIWKLAWQDARFNLGRLTLFMSSIIIGIAALTSIKGFNENLQNDIDGQAKQLLGADLAVENDDYEPAVGDSALAFIDSMALEKARDARFASMAYFPQSNGSRLIQVVALKGEFPFYGEIEVTPASQPEKFRQGEAVLIDQSLANQFEVEIGDSLKLGQGIYPIAGFVTRFPGLADIRTTVAPSVYLPYQKLDETELIQYGSRVEYNSYYRLEEQNLEEIEAKLKELREQYGFSWDTVEEEKQDMSRGFQNLYRYFNLLSFVALILGSIGVASSIYVYMREKRNAAAVLRCIGADGWQVFWVFLIQVLILGFLGSILGVLIGLGIQFLLPAIVSDFLPVEVSIHISYQAILTGLIVGLIIALLFSVLPLINLRFVPPLSILRGVSTEAMVKSKFRMLVIGLIIIFPWLFAVHQTRDWMHGTGFYLGLLAAFVVLFLISRLLMWVVERLLPADFKYTWRLGFSNLFRPNNQTSVLVIVIGLAAFLIATMALIENSLLKQVEFVGSGERSNTVLFDIQPYQQAQVVDLVKSYDLPVQQLVPIVTMRISEVKGKTVKEWQEDTASDVSNWRLIREYRVTYRDSLIGSEELIAGEFQGQPVAEGDSIFISITQDMAESLNLELNDPITFNVQGVPIQTYVGSLREVDWRRIQTNFMVVFPPGVLEQAPQFYVIITRIDNEQVAARFQQDLVRQFSNVSLIDLTLILSTLDEIFDKIAVVIQFMALFSILTGMLVLTAAVINSKFARLRENVMLRTIGALKKQIVEMTLVEYGYLGAFAGLSGVLLALGSSWGLANFFFDISFFPDLLSLFIIWLAVVFLTLFIGWINTRSIISRSPLEVLRKEV
ncbi:MAG: ABC transporter permease [Candidatus Cyclobacteriaceae bacterium M3_2C_046]